MDMQPDLHLLVDEVPNTVGNDQEEVERLRRTLRKAQRETRELRKENSDLSKRLKWNRRRVRQLEFEFKRRQNGFFVRARSLLARVVFPD
jgi:peptidoglycan hydrolase CwlO-like protein